MLCAMAEHRSIGHKCYVPLPNTHSPDRNIMSHDQALIYRTEILCPIAKHHLLGRNVMSHDQSRIFEVQYAK